jgi:hypothetical protein
MLDGGPPDCGVYRRDPGDCPTRTRDHSGSWINFLQAHGDRSRAKATRILGVRTTSARLYALPYLGVARSVGPTMCQKYSPRRDGVLRVQTSRCRSRCKFRIAPSRLQASRSVCCRRQAEAVRRFAQVRETSLDLGSNFIDLRFWEIRSPRRRSVCLTDAKQACRPRRDFFAISCRHCGHKIRITGGNSPVLAGSIVGW